MTRAQRAGIGVIEGCPVGAAALSFGDGANATQSTQLARINARSTAAMVA